MVSVHEIWKCYCNFKLIHFNPRTPIASKTKLQSLASPWVANTFLARSSHKNGYLLQVTSHRVDFCLGMYCLCLFLQDNV